MDINFLYYYKLVKYYDRLFLVEKSFEKQSNAQYVFMEKERFLDTCGIYDIYILSHNVIGLDKYTELLYGLKKILKTNHLELVKHLTRMTSEYEKEYGFK